jgi:hypothetical protein
MKAIVASILLFLATAVASYADLTNGVFYTDSEVECHLISQNGSTTTNQLTAGKTYLVTDTLIELQVTNKTTLYFSGGPMIEVSPGSTLTINVFDADVKNLDSQPRKADIGNINLGINFNKGEFSVIYPNTDANSSCIANTPFASYQLGGGKYFFRVSDKSAIVYVVEGIMQMHGDKKVDKTSKGNLAVALPFDDGGKESRILTSIKTLKDDENERYATPVLLAEKKWNNVGFIVVGGRVIGVWLK